MRQGKFELLKKGEHLAGRGESVCLFHAAAEGESKRRGGTRKKRGSVTKKGGEKGLHLLRGVPLTKRISLPRRGNRPLTSCHKPRKEGALHRGEVIGGRSASCPLWIGKEGTGRESPEGKNLC